MAVIKKPISLRTDLYDYGEKVAHDFFQDNFSMFVGYLISCHKERIITNETTIKNETDHSATKAIDKDMDEIIDGIEGFFENN